MLEATLIVNINDSLEDVEELASFSKVIVDKVPGCTLVVNLIPFNDIDHPLYETPTLDTAKLFQQYLCSRGTFRIFALLVATMKALHLGNLQQQIEEHNEGAMNLINIKHAHNTWALSGLL